MTGEGPTGIQGCRLFARLPSPTSPSPYTCHPQAFTIVAARPRHGEHWERLYSHPTITTTTTTTTASTTTSTTTTLLLLLVVVVE